MEKEKNGGVYRKRNNKTQQQKGESTKNIMVIELAPQLSFPHKRKSSFHSHLQVLLF
jgi:hypothetical protein